MNDDLVNGLRDLVGEGVLTISEAIRFSGWSRTHVYDLMKEGILPFVEEEGVRGRRIPKKALVYLLARGVRWAK